MVDGVQDGVQELVAATLVLPDEDHLRRRREDEGGFSVQVVHAHHQGEVPPVGLGPDAGRPAIHEEVDGQGRTVEGREDVADARTVVQGAGVHIPDAQGRQGLGAAVVEAEAQDPGLTHDQDPHDIEAGLTVLVLTLAAVVAHVVAPALSQPVLVGVGACEAQQRGHERAVRTVDAAVKARKISGIVNPVVGVAAAPHQASKTQLLGPWSNISCDGDHRIRYNIYVLFNNNAVA